jgi:gliding motility-associated-like protein
METPAGSDISFAVKDTVNATFTYTLTKGCRNDTIQYFNDSNNGKTYWNWQFDNVSSTNQNPTVIYNRFGNKTTQLIAGNGFCSDTSSVNFFLDHDSLRAAFTMPSVYCPNDFADFTDASAGKIINWFWQFGNGFSSNLQNPPLQVYSAAGSDHLYPVQLIVQSDKDCYDTAVNFLKVAISCTITVPTAFTPNNDGLNDYLYPLNAYKASDLEFRIFNKFGQVIFYTNNWTRRWDGTFKGMKQPAGAYVWMLQYTDNDTGKKVFMKGAAVLIR